MPVVLGQLALTLGMIGAAGSAHAIVIFDDWETNEGGSPNYQVSVENSLTADAVDIVVTIDPWDAEALFVAFDLGDVDVATWELSNLSTLPTAGGTIAIVSTDCDPTENGRNACTDADVVTGNNTGDFSVPLLVPDGDWEYVVQLGSNGFEGYQTFSWTLQSTLGGTATLDESLFQVAGARSQAYCENGGTLDNGDAGCGGSDKSYSATPTASVPEPATVALLGIGLAGFGMVARRRRSRFED